MNLIVVIRNNGERTYEACKDIIYRQVNPDVVFTVSESPFYKTLQSAYKTGIENPAKWMVTVDADVLLYPDAINKIAEHAEGVPENIFQLEGRVLDKFTGIYRQAGFRIYRTKQLKRAAEIIETSFHADLRPETMVLQQMSNEGHYSRRTNLISGIHDYEQWNRDIFRKAYVHAHKHANLFELLLPYWMEQKNHDPDFKIAITGFVEGLWSDEKPVIDSIWFEEKWNEVKYKHGFNEKAKLDVNQAIKLTLSICSHASAKPLSLNQLYDENEPLFHKASVLKKEQGILKSMKYMIMVGLKKALNRIG